ncbi:hypothetical protein FLONG3_7793 [Fusarium longipes]|uniref:Rhodopsin domain-containing protein n=1 Tax=Fusarium longipes TaxID=694270 RepID=A0A395SB51_9HYPO|nr:hypothetical protein FLONG3_7793 [Fusarium longipes]
MNITAEQAERSHESKSDLMLGVSVMLMVLGSVLVGLRLWCRRLIRATGRDDIAAVLAWAFMIACGTSVASMTGYGLGRHDWTLAPDQLILYGRAFWDPRIKGKCFQHQTLMWYINGILHIFIDLAIIVMPLPIVWKLQLPLSQKLLLSGIFGLGFFTIAISIFRLQWLTPQRDITWWNVTAASWSLAELVSAIACSCLPTFKPLVSKAKRFAPSHGTRSGTSRLQNPSKADSDKTFNMMIEDAPYGSRPPMPNSVHSFGTETRITSWKHDQASKEWKTKHRSR